MIVDAQCHWFSPTLLDALLDIDEYPRCRRDADGYAFEVAPGRFVPWGPRFTDLETQLEMFATAGVDTIVSSSGSFGDVDRLEPKRAVEVAHAVNAERAAAEKAHAGRFYGLATIPWQDTDAALAALDDAVVHLGLRGALIHSNINGAPVDSDRCLPVYARMAELGVPLFIHPTTTLLEPKLRDYGLEYLVGFLFDTSLAALRLVLSGIVADSPGLKIVLPHCGGTLPYLAGRIDASHEKPYSLGRRLDPLPSEQLRGFYTDTVAQDANTLAFADRFFADGHVMFASDYPFFPVDEQLAFAREHGADLGGNAARLLGLS
ncbi:MAG TPA: amidohydrolase family protein [Gaiellaceae bacterium]|nr:amidohydrolase family protein [Gaiellaceae bacterium]